MSRSRESLRIGVIGAGSEQYVKELGGVTQLPVIDLSEGAEAPSGITTAFLFVEVPDQMTWREWFAEMEQGGEIWELLLPALANPAKILLVGFSPHEKPRHRGRSREFLNDLVDGVAAYATTAHGIDASVNAVEVPPSADRRLLLERLTQFAEHGHVAADGHVIEFESLEESPVSLAIAVTEL